MTGPEVSTGPFGEGMLDVGDGNQVYWQLGGNPDGKPALMVHGGPGGGFPRGAFGLFRRAGYKLVLFDQRGCGDSTPHASDPAADLRSNTTRHLIGDMERLREHLGIGRWLVSGVSWGTTLALAYAQQHPERVSEIILTSVVVGRRRDVDWLYRDAGRFYPEAFERFVAGSGASCGGDIPGAYARLMADPDPAVREKAADDWSDWEDALLSHELQGSPGLFVNVPLRARLALVRICAHYNANYLFLEDNELIRNAGKLAGIPGAIVHGRMDMNGPLEGPWELARAWPDGQLLVAEDAGHLDSPTKRGYVREAVNRFAGH